MVNNVEDVGEVAINTSVAIIETLKIIGVLKELEEEDGYQ